MKASPSTLRRLAATFAISASLWAPLRSSSAEEITELESGSTLEEVLLQGGVSEDELHAAMLEIFQSMSRIGRFHLVPAGEMETIEAIVVEGIEARINDRVLKLEEARAAHAEAEKLFAERREELDTVDPHNTIERAKAQDAYVEAELHVDDMARAVVAAQEYQTLTTAVLIDSGLDHLTAKLDAHSEHLEPGHPMLASMGNAPQAPRRAGVGLLVKPDGDSQYILDKGLVVVATMDPADISPAREAGMLPGDLITHIDGDPLAGLSLRDGHSRLGGANKSKVVLAGLREAGPFEIEVQRESIQIANVTHRIVNGGYGLIKVLSFMEAGVTGKVKAAVLDIQQQLGGQDNVDGYIISFENNGGGLLDEAGDMADLFIDGSDQDPRQNRLITTAGRNGIDKTMTATPGDITGGKPLAVLVNGGSASASEILAGTLQLHGRAIVVGATSFGKGSVQTIGAAPGSTDAGLRMTIGLYYVGPADQQSPYGRSIQAVGVQPDVVTPFVGAAETSESNMKNHLTTPNAVVGRHDAATCDKRPHINAAELDPSLIDSRTGEPDYVLACAVLALQDQERHSHMVASYSQDHGVRLLGAGRSYSNSSPHLLARREP